MTRWLASAWLACLALAPSASLAHTPPEVRLAELTRRLGAADTSGGRAELYLQRAELHRVLGDFESALDDLRRARRFDPGRAELDFFRGGVLFDAGRTAEAERVLRRFLAAAAHRASSQPDRRVSALRLLGRMALQSGRPDESARYYRRAIELGGRLDPQIGRECAHALAAAGRTPESAGCHLGSAAHVGRGTAVTAVTTEAVGADRAPSAGHTQETLLPAGAAWRYLDDGTDLGFVWVDPDFDDSSWSSGAAQLGYGDGDEATVVGFGPEPTQKFITTYFRAGFAVADPSSYSGLTLNLLRDDGAVVYLNGAEVMRSNMPPGSLDASTVASIPVGGAGESQFFGIEVDHRLLLPGANVVAAEVHQHAGTSSDLSFDLELIGDLAGTGSARITRGPYLQMATPNSVLVRWRTDLPTDTRVSWGLDPANLLSSTEDATPTTEHAAPVTGLLDDTTYFYSVGSTSATLAGADSITYFRTPPLTGFDRPTRVWVIGDSGSCGTSTGPYPSFCPRARAVRNAFLAHGGGEATDLWLLLGDNAYHSGTDDEYQKGLFDTYPSLLRRTVVWPALGNHDGIGADSSTQSGPYYDIFSLPTLAEVGGAPSMTEAYYSFDFGNIHFVVLDSFESPRTPPSAMLDWLVSDLTSTSADWLIAFWHHPPYSKGSHDSDDPEGLPLDFQLVEMRENVAPILEDFGVDLVLSGHSHTYERSFLLDGHYGLSDTLTAAHKKDGGLGSPADPFVKPSSPPGLSPHEGAVYGVAGSSGLLSARVGTHPAMAVTLDRMGSLIIDIDGNALEAAFVDEHRAVRDRFRIVKGCDGDPVSGDGDGDGSCDDLDCNPGNPEVSHDRLDLVGATVDLEEEFTACSSIRAGRHFTVGPSGRLSLRAGETIALGPGFRVSGELVLAVDADLRPPGS